jgi:hypothetical protein
VISLYTHEVQSMTNLQRSAYWILYILVILMACLAKTGWAYGAQSTPEATPQATPTPIVPTPMGSNAVLAIGAAMLVIILLVGIAWSTRRKR